MFPRNAPDAHIGQTLPTSKPPQNRPSKTTKKGRSEFKRKFGGITRIKWNGSWLWEIAAVFLSIVCLALLVAFLVKINGTPYGTWQYTASPNTIISIIATITKTSLLVSVSACLSQLKWNQYQGPTAKPLYSIQAVDQASRGPWGSLEVLLTGIFKLRVDVLTLAGAFITIIALAIDPFAQQVLAFPERTVRALNETATIYYTQVYNETEEHLSSEITSSLLSALTVGLAQDTNPSPSQCSSSACEFPEFVTMGVCSHCEDLSSQVIQHCGRSPAEGNTLQFESHVYCNYSLPNSASTYAILPMWASVLSPNDSFVTMEYRNMQIRYTEDNSYTGQLTNGKLSHFISWEVFQNVTWTHENKTADPPGPKVSECTLYLCEQKFSSSHYVATDQASHVPNLLQTQELLQSSNTSMRPPDGTDFLADNPRYYFNVDTMVGTQFDLTYVFNITSNTPDKNGLNIYVLLRDRGIHQIIKSVSTSFSNTLRSRNANPLAEKMTGIALRSEPYIKVRWPWIILPIFTTLASLLLLIGTLITSKMQHATLWKDSVIPLLMSDLRTYPDHEISVLRDVTEVNSISKIINVSMSQDKGPLTFSEK